MTVTSTTAHLLFFTALACGAVAPAHAAPQKSLPGLAYVSELLVQPPRLGNRVDSKKCGLSINAITDIVIKRLTLIYNNLGLFFFVRASFLSRCFFMAATC